MIVLQFAADSVAGWVALLVAAFAGGAVGAAVGAIPAFALSGGLVVVGELIDAVSGSGSDVGTILSQTVGLGPLLGPHVAFAGGAAGAAYAARKGHLDGEFDYYPAKDVLTPNGFSPAVLAVGGAFGIVGLLVRRASLAAGLPLSSIALAVVVSGLLHRLTLGYPLLGNRRNADVFEAAAEESRGPVANGGSVPVEDPAVDVEALLPEQFDWPHAGALGIAVGGLAGVLTALSGSVVLAFGLSAASLGLLLTDHDWVVPTHQVTLPAATAAVAFAGGLGALALGPALAVGAVFGTIGSLLAELAQRTIYARGHTHVDPGFVAILAASLLVGVIVLAGVFAGPQAVSV